MGCDIHGYIERKKKPEEGKHNWPFWELACRVYGNRNYTFFGVLNNVREELAMFPDRGFPDDASGDLEAIYEHWEGDGHSHSWISRKEVEFAVSSEATVKITRFWSNSQIERLKKGDWDAMYPCCGGTSQPDWAEATFEVPVSAVGVKREFELILKEMDRFPEYDTRFVFFFDN
jgi:hypothetical protein